MAARRLIAVLVVLLVVSSIAAALAPEARRAETTSTEPTTPDKQAGSDATEPPANAKPKPEEIPGGALVERTITADPGRGLDKPGKGQSGHAAPPTIDADVGDRVALQVASEETVTIEIPALGLLETAAAGAPARFDLLLREPGSYAVEIAGGATVGTIDVAKPGADADADANPDQGASDEGSSRGPRKDPGSGADSGMGDTATTT